MNRTYICIDLKSFYASVECVERNLNPLTTNLVVADETRTNKTICLAVSPSLKKYGLSGRSRLYEVIETVKKINITRKYKYKIKNFNGESYDDIELENNKSLSVGYIIAKPRMAKYMEYSSKIFNIYLKYLSEEDILVYSIDEVFCDVTNYLKYYKLTPEELITKIIKDVYTSTGITATGGIGTNMFLAKVAMDVVAKKSKANEFGVRIASLNQQTFKEQLWNHEPITDIWRIGHGIKTRLEKHKIFTLGDIARTSLNNEELLFKEFGVNAEVLIDHAWGYEPCTIKQAKSYKPESSSLSRGQVLKEPYTYQQTKIIVEEMAELLSLDLVKKNYLTDQIILTIGYDIINIENKSYKGAITFDHYGRKVPKHSHGTLNLNYQTSSTKTIVDAFLKLYDKIVDPSLFVRRLTLIATKLIDVEDEITFNNEITNLFIDAEKVKKEQQNIITSEKEERNLQKTLLDIKEKYGKNAILKGINLEKDSTMLERNSSIGGHHE